MSADVLAEALARVEHKVDIIIRFLKVPDMLLAPMQFSEGTNCPVCKMPISYQVDIIKRVVVRKCGCKSGKLPPTADLFPVTAPAPGAKNANLVPSSPEAE